MALILNIETATNVCSVCLAYNGNVVTYKEKDEPNIHSSFLSVFIEELFSNNSYNLLDLSAVAISKGPGSYTGLRIGISVAKGIAYGLNIPLLGISTLQHMVYGAQQLTNNQSPLFAPMIDARRMEVYTALLNKDLEYVVNPTSLTVNHDLFHDYRKNQDVYFFGDGMPKAKTLLQNQKNVNFLPDFKISSINMVKLAEKAFARNEQEDLAYFTPMYLKEFILDGNKNSS